VQEAEQVSVDLLYVRNSATINNELLKFNCIKEYTTSFSNNSNKEAADKASSLLCLIQAPQYGIQKEVKRQFNLSRSFYHKTKNVYTAQYPICSISFIFGKNLFEINSIGFY